MKKTIISTFMALTFISIAQANEKTGDLKSSATMEATCSISANQIGFGAIATPLLAQTANSEMTVKCNNASAYTIDLAYGGIYGQGTGSAGTYTYKTVAQTGNYQGIKVYKDDIAISGYMADFECNYEEKNKIKIYTQEAALFYGVTWIRSTYYSDTKNLCATRSTISSTVFNNLGASSGYAYGVMNGMSKGDKLAYSIAVPGDATKVWNAGNNSYRATGTGDNQIIPMIAKIVPDKSGSKYPAPDMYIDTVTAVISY